MSKKKGRDLLVWLDDAQNHLQRGLTRDSLRRLGEIYPEAIIAVTIHGGDLDVLSNVDPPLHEVLRRPFDDLVLSSTLGQMELASAKTLYPALADDRDLARLPELFAAVNRLIDRYRSHSQDEPYGTAVARAVVDWQRAGMPPGSIDTETLRTLSALVLNEVAPNRALGEAEFEAGLDWSTKEVSAFAALVRREPAIPSQVQRYRGFDAVVSWAQANQPPLEPTTWVFVVTHANHSDQLSVGIAAYEDKQLEIARDAWERAARGLEPSLAATATLLVGMILGELGRTDEEIAVYDDVVARYGDDPEPALREQTARALFNKGVTLGQLNRSDEEIVVYDDVVARYGDDPDPALASRRPGRSSTRPSD